jgi:DNA-binding CsgD family transcriptional regulator
MTGSAMIGSPLVTGYECRGPMSSGNTIALELVDVAQALGPAVSSIGRPEFFARLMASLSGFVPFTNTDLVVVELAPEVEVAPVLIGVESSEDRYPAAIRYRYIPQGFRRCPEIALLRGGLPAGIYSMTNLGASRFLDSPSYEDYFRWLGVSNFYDLFGDLGDGRVAGWSVGRYLGEPEFAPHEDRTLRQLAPLLIPLITRHCQLALPAQVGPAAHIALQGELALAALIGRLAKEKLSERERQIAILVARGLSTKQIARRLDIAPMTEAVHRRNIFRKLGLRSQVDLMAHCLAGGLIAESRADSIRPQEDRCAN